MPSRFSEILEFLSVKNVLAEIERILNGVAQNPEHITNVDRQKMHITEVHLDEEGNPFEQTHSLDDVLLSQFKSEIKSKTVEELRELKFGSKEGALPVKASDYASTIKNLEAAVHLGYKQLQESGLPIPLTLAEISSFCMLLNRRQIELTSELANPQAINNSYPFRGYRFTEPKIEKTGELLDRIAVSLIKKGLINEGSKTSFISLFTEKWDGSRIVWNGSPKDFYGFYASFFGKPTFQNTPVIEIKGNTKKLEQMLYCFKVINPETRKQITTKEMHKYNSHPTSNSLNKAISNIIEDHIRA